MNPWNPERSPGGSSGGESAIIAALGSCLGLGSDIGGSVRMPAHACGICSLKPTSSRLSMVGHVPLLPGQEAILAQPGPMARTVADLNLAMKVLAAPGQETFDPSIPPVPWREPSDVKLENLRIAFFTDNGIISPSPAVRRAVREAAVSLEKRGAIVEEWTPPDLLKALQLYFQPPSKIPLPLTPPYQGGKQKSTIEQIGVMRSMSLFSSTRSRTCEATAMDCTRPLPLGRAVGDGGNWQNGAGSKVG